MSFDWVEKRPIASRGSRGLFCGSEAPGAAGKG